MAFTTWQTLGMEFQTRRGLGMSESLVGTALHTWRKLGSEFHSCTANMMGATTGHRIVITPFTKIATTNLRMDPIVSPSCWRFLRDTMIPGVIVSKNNTHTHTQTDPRQTEFSVTENYNLRLNPESKLWFKDEQNNGAPKLASGEKLVQKRSWWYLPCWPATSANGNPSCLYTCIVRWPASVDRMDQISPPVKHPSLQPHHPVVK